MNIERVEQLKESLKKTFPDSDINNRIRPDVSAEKLNKSANTIRHSANIVLNILSKYPCST